MDSNSYRIHTYLFLGYCLDDRSQIVKPFVVFLVMVYSLTVLIFIALTIFKPGAESYQVRCDKLHGTVVFQSAVARPSGDDQSPVTYRLCELPNGTVVTNP